ncbi:TrbG/VirB9 family P-type conjugative transfer protein [Alcaligenes phenolicus]|uniref:TrbG/VirB9 family P-type conjugative transfer protein n=1 Tax=Alcaligenes TaxID=507 RepID=UPI002AA3B452|nr:TrbG/VirB9 family P-type conjugative transfer protein [Alcaligenes phenolicus]MDK7585083.1 TrbG/VirB9 family P-type conjugative transfer protein [Alcaligenes phenolicus]
MNRFAKTAFAVALACLVATPALALDLPKQAGTDHRIRYANYDPHNVTQLDSVIGVGTMIELEEGENYLFHVFGDSEAYEFTEYTNHLFLKPVVDQADTNLIVVTDRRNYTFRIEYHNERETKQALYKLIMRYPDSEAIEARQQQHEKTVQTAFSQVGLPVNWQAYSKSGDLDLAPIHAWDDGHQTWMQFAPTAEIPAIYRVTDDGQEVLTNYHMADHRTMVLHRTSARWHIRLGGNVVAIHNAAFRQTPTKPHTGTASPSVERVVHGVKPLSLPSSSAGPAATAYPAQPAYDPQAFELGPEHIEQKDGKTLMTFSSNRLPIVQPVNEQGQAYAATTTIRPGNILLIDSNADAWQAQSRGLTHIFKTEEYLK